MVVVCISNLISVHDVLTFDKYKGLTIGNTYIVKNTAYVFGGDRYLIVDDKDSDIYYPIENFRLLSDIREERIESILK